MKKVVVTGGAGFIGNHLTRHLLNKGITVSVIDNLSTGKKENIDDIIGQLKTYTQASILEPEALLSTFEGSDTVFHLAAATSVPESIINPSHYMQTNTIGTLNVIEAAHKAGVKNLVLSSSAAVYGNANDVPLTEQAKPDPQSPYAVSKLDSEYFANIYTKQYNLQITALRYFNVFGPNQPLNGPYAAVIPTFFQQAKLNKPIVIFGDGQQTRDFIFVEDVVKANMLAVGHSGVFNIAAASPVSINTLAKSVIDTIKSHSTIVYETPRNGDIVHSHASIETASTRLKFKPTFSLMQGLSIIASAT